MQVSEKFKDNKLLADIINTGRIWREVSKGIELEECIFCGKNNYHFFISLEGNMSGVYKCLRCGESGNSRTLYEKLGLRIPGIDSRSDWASDKKIEELPDIEKCHEALLSNEQAMDYLVNTRGFSIEVIKRQKLGFVEKRYFRELGGECPAAIFPYIVNGNVSFIHYRTIPPSPKSFSSPTGRESTLYNIGALKEGIKEIIFVEGECDTISLLDHGVENVVGVPGANTKKAMWLDILDQVNPDKIYIMYDNDDAGHKAGQSLASRIGITKCWKIELPNCKDVNEFFQNGGTLEEFNKFKDNAQLFDIAGVQSASSSLDQLEASLEGKDLLNSTYDSPWESLNKIIGFENGDVIDISAPEKIGKTTFALNLADYLSYKYKENVCFICLEMTNARLARKWLSMVCEVDDSISKSKEEAVEKLKILKEAIPQAKKIASEREGDLYFCYPIISSIDDVYKLIHDVIRRYGCKTIVFDNLQLLADRTLKNPAHRTIHLSQISKNFAGISKDYNIKFIRILQPHRIKEGQIISSDNIDGASQIAKDCDCMILLHRNKVADINQKQFEEIGFLETNQSFDSKMLVKVSLSRYSSGGTITLEFDGAMSKVREYNKDRKQEMTMPKDDYTVQMETEPKKVIIECSTGEKI